MLVSNPKSRFVINLVINRFGMISTNAQRVFLVCDMYQYPQSKQITLGSASSAVSVITAPERFLLPHFGHFVPIRPNGKGSYPLGCRISDRSSVHAVTSSGIILPSDCVPKTCSNYSFGRHVGTFCAEPRKTSPQHA
jgi:hypothetical protein